MGASAWGWRWSWRFWEPAPLTRPQKAKCYLCPKFACKIIHGTPCMVLTGGAGAMCVAGGPAAVLACGTVASSLCTGLLKFIEQSVHRDNAQAVCNEYLGYCDRFSGSLVDVFKEDI